MDINNGMNRNGGMEWQAQTQFRANEIMKKYWVHTWISYVIVLLDIIFLIYMVVFKMDYRINYIIGGFAELLLTWRFMKNVILLCMRRVLTDSIHFFTKSGLPSFMRWLGIIKGMNTLRRRYCGT